jgi:hypothetical protein
LLVTELERRLVPAGIVSLMTTPPMGEVPVF